MSPREARAWVGLFAFLFVYLCYVVFHVIVDTPLPPSPT